MITKTETHLEWDTCLQKNKSDWAVIWNRIEIDSSIRKEESLTTKVHSRQFSWTPSQIERQHQATALAQMQSSQAIQIRIRLCKKIRHLKRSQRTVQYDLILWNFQLRFADEDFDFSLTQFSKVKLDKWLSRVKEQRSSTKKSLASLVLQPHNKFPKTLPLLFSPAAIGFIFHESLGHRLESDDHPSPLKFNKKWKSNYEVYDVPGRPTWWGYSPVGDDLTLGRSVALLKNKNGLATTMLLHASTGNLRAAHNKWHAIIRQRNLVTKIKGPVSPPPITTQLLQIDEITLGEYHGDNKLTLQISQSTFQTKKGPIHLRPWSLELRIDEISKINLYGKRQITHLAGGCHKGLQRQLPISFFTHSGWMSANF